MGVIQGWVHLGRGGAPFPNSCKGAAWALLGQAGCSEVETLLNGRTDSVPKCLPPSTKHT